VSRAALRPVGRLTRAAERVAETQDLSASIEVRRRDELGRLASSINEMLSALDASRRQQRQLVSDAGHELRTPLTSLRTNIEVLARQHDMPEPERQRAFDDITAQLEELTRLMDDLFELARDDRAPVEAATELQLDELLIAAVERARPRSPDVEIAITAMEPTRVLGQRDHLERAFVNVLDNALKWSPAGSRVDVGLVGGAVTVRDHGVGIDAADLPFVFDRFYRASSARSAPGSGLGLAIVRQVVDEHDGTVVLAPADGGGTVATITLPIL
jgi:signal transduction histidine kinase